MASLFELPKRDLRRLSSVCSIFLSRLILGGHFLSNYVSGDRGGGGASVVAVFDQDGERYAAFAFIEGGEADEPGVRRGCGQFGGAGFSGDRGLDCRQDSPRSTGYDSPHVPRQK